MERMKTRLKRVFLFMLSALMLFTSLPLSVFAKVNYNYDDLTDKQSEIVNKLTPVKPAKPEAGKTAEDLIKNPDQPAIYTLRKDYKVQRGEKYQVDYQPYIASVGAGATQAEKDKVKKTMPMPDIAGYEKPQKDFTIDYDTVKNAANGKNEKGNDINGFRYSANEVFNYDALSNKIQIKHVFQKLDDFTKYTNPDGSVGEEGALITTQNGNTGSTVQASPLSETDPRRKGFVPEADYINMQVPENAENFILEYRYNRAHYDVVFDTQGGTAVPARTLYYEQKIPKINNVDQPTKVGGNFLGWKPSVDLKGRIEGVDKTFKAGEIIKDSNGNPILGLDANLIMPASKVTFTAVWKDKEKADYAVQFWAEKADHADGASLADKYDYIGTRVYKDKDTGTRPDLDNEPVKDIVFTDLDKARLAKIWAGARFNRGKDLYLNKFYVYNQALTHDQNKDPENVNLVKSVDLTGETVYNIYYDRQVYNLYFTKSNVVGSAFYPEISKDGKEVGKEGNPYHFKARFNQNLVGLWPDDVKEVRGFTEGNNSLGWLPNLKKPKYFYRDTPPYRLSANLFIDFPELENQGGYVSEIDLGNGQTKPASITDLSFGIDQNAQTMPHQIDFWLDDFDGEKVIDYDLYTIKSDTNSSNYHDFLPPDLQGFTPKDSGGRGSEFKEDSDLDDLNEEREEITPFPEVYSKELDENGEPKQKGKLYFMRNFPGDDREFDQNGYLKFEYSRNKYPLRFNYDPSIIRDDSYFNDKNQLDTFYEFPLKALSPEADTEKSYKTGNPKNILDNPEKLQALGLTDLVFKDKNDKNKLKVKRPDNLSDQLVFKGWALDPAGTTLVSDKKSEKMPSHAVNLYAKWGEPDYQWKVTFDPNGGSLRNIKEEDLTKERKTVQVGDIGQEEIKTFAKKEANDGDKQVFTVIQRQKLVAPKFIPKRKGYDFMGWEVIRYKKDSTTGDYTTEQDTSYRETYKVPELYSFGNDVVSPIYLKAIWVPNDRVDVKVVHHIMSLDLKEETKKITETLHNKRTGYLVATSADKQNEEYILATNDELKEKLPADLKTLYNKYNDRVKANNTFFQTFKVEPEKIPDPNDSSKMIENPKFKDNVFHFFYRPFRTRDYKVNYIDERGKEEVEKFFKGLNLTDTSSLKDDDLLKANESNKKKFEDNREAFEKLIKEYQIVDPEAGSNGNRHYDARNYRQIPGWALVGDPQQQLFFDVNEKTNEFLGINGTGADQIFFYYKDVRVIEVPNKDDPVPDGYVRVTFKADKGGAFTDKDGNTKTELYYDVIKGLKSDLLPEPKELEEGKTKEEGKYYITPETGKKFIKWDEKPLLNKNTIVDNDTKDFYVFTAKFEWSGLSASGLVRTEAFKDPNGNWTNDFAPTIEQLKAQLVWMEKGKVEKLPAGAVIKLYDEAGTELTKDEQVYNLVNEKGKADKEELVRTVNVKAKVTFKDGKEPQELTIPITVYKNVYEALNKAGDKPLFLKEAEGKDAKDGGLKDILKDNTENRYIKVTIKPNKDFTNKDDKVYYVNPNAWVEIPNDSNGTTSLINWTADQDAQNENKAANGKFDFTKRHKFTKDTVISPRLSQTSELVVHESYKDSKNKWVNDFIDKELTDANLKKAIQVKNDEAKALGVGDVTIVDDAGEPYANAEALKTALYEKLQEKDDDGKASRIENIKVKVTFANGEVQTLTVPVKVIKNIYQAKTKTGKPDYVPDNYVKVTLDPTTKAKDPQKYFYYVNPDAKVLIPGKDPEGVKEDFTGWTMKADGATGDGTSYKLSERHQFAKDSTIIAQYGQGKAKIKYVDDSGKEIDPKYQIVGEAYPTEKIGKIGDNIPDPVDSQDAEKAAAPKFKGYIISSVSLDKKTATYTDPASATITYKYYKKITTEDKSQNDTQYFPVIFDANSGEFGTDPKNQKIVYVAFDGNSSTLEKVTFEEVRQAIEEKYGKPSKADETFVEWQDKATDGNKVADDYEIKFKGLDQQTHKPLGETFYANYDKASALVKYLDLNGKPIADEFKIDGVEYPTEKGGTDGEAIDKNVYTKDTAPKLTGYKFNRIELNPKDGKYALSNKATIKIYYEKDLDVIAEKDESGNPNKKPEGYVQVKFVPTDKAKDATEKIFYVNPKKDVTIPIANPVANATFTFKEWKMGAKADGAVYNPKTPKKFTEALTTITATYESSQNIIPYDPSVSDPMVRPDGYVRVSFATDDGLKLTKEKAYYVKKNAGIKLGNAELAKPGYKAETGYEFTNWDKEDSLEITDQDVLVTAKATVLKDVDTVKHPDYVKVTFKAGANGVIKENGNTINEKVYYVNPNKYVNLTAPTPDGNTGYDFSTWKSDKSQSDFSLANFVNYKENTTITAQFNQKDAVYPKLDGSTKPAGYVEVTFAISGTGGRIGNDEITTYFVDPNRQVSLKVPKTIAGVGFEFDKWRLGANPADQVINPADQRQYPNKTTIYGSFKKLEDIIPATNQDGTTNLQPVDYVAVLFIGGDHANKVDGQILYYVNPKANPAKTIGSLTKPTVTPDVGWKHTDWDVQDSTEIKDYTFVVAQYEALDDVVPALKDDGTPNKKPDGYVTVTFKSGDNGKIQEKGADITEKVYYVNPAKYVKLTPPTTVPNTSFEFSTWESDGKDFILANNINFTEDTTITAKFNTKGDVIPKTKPDDSEKPKGFVTVNFEIEGQGGQIEANQTTTYFVRPNTDVTIQPPKTTANTGYEFDKWSIDTTEARSYSDPVTTVKGEFSKLNDIIPYKNPDGTVNAKPEGYVIVNFLKGDHGVLDGRTTFYVNPKAGKKLKDLDTKGITVVPSPTYKFDKWDMAMDTPITGPNNINVKAEYTQLPNIIKAGPTDTAPDGYVVIIFETDGRGTITGNKAYEDKTNPKANENEIVYFVNPKKDVKLADATATASQTILPVPSTTPNDLDKYIFDQWRADIDTKTPITRGRVHIAMFKPKEVKLTYDKNGADVTGEVPPVLTVDYDTDVRLAGKGDLAKKDASFKGWKIDEKTYQAGDQINLKADTTAYAQWGDDKKIIEYNPDDNPTTRPDDTYVRVTFAVEDGLKLKEQKAYYVKKDANITLGDTGLVKPKYDVETGYKFDKWDKDDSLVITTDTTVTAKSTKLGTVIPEKDINGQPNAQPEGYKVVVFKVKDGDADKGSITGVNKFYVNPTEYVTINPPTTKANTGFEFGAWDKDTTRPTVYADDVTTIEARFNELKDVVPKTKTDDSEKPKGYVTVTFEIKGQGGNIAEGKPTVYFVNPEKEVTVTPPQTVAETGYVFEKWNQDTTIAKKYTEDTTVKGNFKKLDDIIPGKKDDGTPNAKPDAYITVTFDKGEHGTLNGQAVYYVNPKANKTIADLGKPKVTAETGYKFTGWNFADAKEILSDLTVIAQYKEIDDVIPKTKNDETEKPEGYITVTFSAEENGKLTGQAVYYVNPNKAHVLKDKAPKVTPNTGFDFADWDTQIVKSIQYKDKYVIKALYNAKNDVIPQERTDGTDKPAGYLKVIFANGDHGNLTGKTVYYVNPNKEVTVPAPTVTASVGYEFSKWDKALKQKFTADTTITAQYTERDNIIPQEKTDGSDKPFGYKTVTFKADAKGSLEGKTVYYVNPEKIVDLTDTAKEITKNPNTGYTAEGGKWKNSDSKNLNDTFNKDTEFVFNFAERPDVIKKIDDNTKLPNGYVTVKLIPTDKATDETKVDKVYFVNPLKEVTITETPVGTKVKDANDVSYDYRFTGWTVTRGAINSWKGSTVSGKFIQDTDITAKYSVTLGNIMPLPLAKDNAVTAINDIPKAEDLIKNIPGSSTDPLPSGTTIKYATGGEPKVDKAGNTTAKVEVKYPNGKTSIVEVPVTVVDNVVPQTGNDKPLVPDSYIKVTVDPTDAATDNTNNKKIFLVKPNTEVKLDGIYDPIGKDIVEGKVTKPNKFTKWTLLSGNPVVEYKVVDNSITASFAEDSTIIANYENVENIPAVGKENPWFSQYSKPEPKDFIKNAYDDNNPDAVGTLPPGTKFAFKPGTEPDTGSPDQRQTTIVVTYPNGEVKEKVVPYKVTGDVVEQEPGNGKPNVPDNFVQVKVKTTDKATEDVTRTFWVNPKIEVTISVSNPKGKYVPKDQNNPSDFTWKFNGWETEDKTKSWNDTIKDRFTAETTTIVAKYIEGQAELVDIYYTTESWKGVNNYLPREEQLKDLVTSKVPGEVESVELLTDSQDFAEYAYSKLSENNIDQINRPETINAKVTLKDGTVSIVEIPIVVYKNIYEGLTNGGKPDYVAQAERDLGISNPGRDDNVYVRVTLIPTAKAKNQQRKTYYVRKNASVRIPEISAEGRDAYKFIYWKAEKPGKGQDNPNYGWATRSMSMFRSAEPINKDDLVNNGEIIDKVDGNTRMSFDRDTDIVAQYKTPTPTPDEPDKPNPDYPNYPEYRPNYSGGSTMYIEKPVEKVIKVPDNAFVKEVRYMQGFKGKFRPFDGLTRAEAAQILANALKEDGYKYDPNYKISYKDIGNAWYTEAVKIVTQAKVFKGYDDGNFKPQEKITRAEWIGTLKRFQELRDLSGNHMNLREGHWAMAEIEAAYQAGWLAIYSDGLADFKADEFIPRQEVAAVSNKAFERVLDKTYIKRNDKALVNYKDINDKMWSYEDILCASNTFLHDKKLYRAHGIDMSNEIFNINLDGFTITKDKFQRIER